MNTKHRLSASVDTDLIEAAEDAVARGGAGSLSAWVNDALRLKLAQDRRLEALAAFIAEYETAHGEITDDERRQAARRARARAITVRGMQKGKQPAARRRRTSR